MEVGGELLNSAHAMNHDGICSRRASEKNSVKEQLYTLLSVANLAQIKIALNQTDEAETYYARLSQLPKEIAKIMPAPYSEESACRRYLFVRNGTRKQSRYSPRVVQRQRYESFSRKDREHTDRIKLL
jgi:hypothetical protein